MLEQGQGEAVWWENEKVEKNFLLKKDKHLHFLRQKYIQPHVYPIFYKYMHFQMQFPLTSFHK